MQQANDLMQKVTDSQNVETNVSSHNLPQNHVDQCVDTINKNTAIMDKKTAHLSSTQDTVNNIQQILTDNNFITDTNSTGSADATDPDSDLDFSSQFYFKNH